MAFTPKKRTLGNLSSTFEGVYRVSSLEALKHLLIIIRCPELSDQILVLFSAKHCRYKTLISTSEQIKGLKQKKKKRSVSEHRELDYRKMISLQTTEQ